MLIAMTKSASILDLVADELHASKAACLTFDPLSQVNNGLQQFRRCTFNRPETLLRESLFSAIAHAETDIEPSLLIAKLIAVRYVIQSIDEDPKFILGELVDLPSEILEWMHAHRSKAKLYLPVFGGARGLHSSEIDLIELIEVLDENRLRLSHTPTTFLRKINLNSLN